MALRLPLPGGGHSFGRRCNGKQSWPLSWLGGTQGDDAVPAAACFLDVPSLEREAQPLRGRSLVNGDLAPPHWTVSKQVVIGVEVSLSTDDPDRNVCSLAHGFVLLRGGEASEPRQPLVGPGVREAGASFSLEAAHRTTCRHRGFSVLGCRAFSPFGNQTTLDTGGNM